MEEMEKKKPIVVAVANNKGGVAKTTTTYALGHIWAEKGYKVLMIDLDSQANLTLMSSPLPMSEIPSSICEPLKYREEPIILMRPDGLHLIPSALDLANIEMETAAVADRIFMLADLIDNYCQDYDVILLDCPPALGLLTYNAMIASDCFIVPCTADRLSYEGMYMILNFANKIKNNPRLNPKLRCSGIVITRFHKNRINTAFVERIRKDTKGALVDPCVRETTKVQQAMACNKDIFVYNPDGNATLDYIEVAKVLEERILKSVEKK